MWELCVKGGILMIPIAVCSVIALGVFLERLWSLQRGLILPQALIKRIETLVAEKRLSDARIVCEENDNPMARLMATALRHASKDRQRLKEAVEEVGKYEGAELERYVEVLGTIAAVAPLLGLLGTIFGMIKVFQRIEAAGLGDPSVFASGIWEALITTAAGLVVAIPAFIFYKYILSRADQLILEMEERSLRVIDLLAQDST